VGKEDVGGMSEYREHDEQYRFADRSFRIGDRVVFVGPPADQEQPSMISRAAECLFSTPESKSRLHFLQLALLYDKLTASLSDKVLFSNRGDELALDWYNLSRLRIIAIAGNRTRL
jgi:hypothetical protein